MAVTILEALENARLHMENYSRNPSMKFHMELADNQLENAIVLLKKGYDSNELVEPLLEKYGDVHNVPEVEPQP